MLRAQLWVLFTVVTDPKTLYPHTPHLFAASVRRHGWGMCAAEPIEADEFVVE